MTSLELRKIFENLNCDDLFGCDCSPSNIFLYQNKYRIFTETSQEAFFRFYYENSDSKTKKCAFPIPFQNASKDYLYNSIKYLLKTYKNVEFYLYTQNQKNQIDLIFANHFQNLKINWKTDRSESDYIYLQENLAQLPGQNYQKKKNHVSHFLKTYENQWNFQSFDATNITQKQKEDISTVAKKWFYERSGETSIPLQEELSLINLALENFSILNLKGGIIYIQNEPVAMTIASGISKNVLDIHFEKSLAEPAKNGAYAAINQFFAKTCSDFLYLNREEDLGIEGLRKAKLSYKPQIILDKFSGIVENI